MRENENVHILDKIRRTSRASSEQQASTVGAGGGTYDPMEARVAKLEAHVEHIQSDITSIKDEMKGLRSDARTDFRLLFGALITVALGLAALMAKGFDWL